MRLRGVQDLTILNFVGCLVAQVEVNHSTAHLDRTTLSRIDLKAFLDHDKSTELTQVVQENESVIKELDLGMVT